MTVTRKFSIFARTLRETLPSVDDALSGDGTGELGRRGEDAGEDGRREEADVERRARRLRARLVDEVVRGGGGGNKSGGGGDDTRVRREVGAMGGGGDGGDVVDVERARATRLGEALRAASEEGRKSDVERMQAVCALILEICAEILKPVERKDAGRDPMPPLGTHVIRRIEDADDADRSVYFQEQCSYKFDTVRTADHFIDGERQRVYASVKLQALPRVEMSGAVMTVYLEPPPKFEAEERESSPREGCFVEIGGMSGHPDYLRRNENQRDGGEIYEFNLPNIRLCGLARKHPVGELDGEIVISCAKTKLMATLKFRKFDVEELSVPFRNIVSGSIVRKHRKSPECLILGTWDTRVMMNNLSNDAADAAETLFEFSDASAPPFTTATGYRSLARVFRHPAQMSNRKLWQCIVEAMRAADLNEPERSVVRELLDDASPGTVEMMEKQVRMTYEMAIVTADSLPADAPPPLPRFWFPQRGGNEEMV